MFSDEITLPLSADSEVGGDPSLRTLSFSVAVTVGIAGERLAING